MEKDSTGKFEIEFWLSYIKHVVPLLSHVWLCNHMDCSIAGFPVLHCLLEFVQLLSLESVMPSNHLILCFPLLLLPLILASIRFFPSESAVCIRWPKYWNFSSFNEYSVQFSSSVVSDSLRPYELQHARPPCPSPTPWVHSDSRSSSQWCHPAISSSVSTFPPAPNPSQHQSLCQWVNASHEVAKVLEFQL